MSTATILSPLGSSTTELPFYSNRVSAGFPSPALDHMEQTLSLDQLLGIHTPHTYLVQADGESMQDIGIFDGDVLVVSRGQIAACGDIVIAAINGETFVKRLGKQGETVVLFSENAQYPPRHVMEGDELMIWGVVVASVRRYASHG